MIRRSSKEVKGKVVKGDDDVNTDGGASGGAVEDNSDGDGACYCVRCNKEVTKDDKAVGCELCKKWCHILCDNMPIQMYIQLHEGFQPY